MTLCYLVVMNITFDAGERLREIRECNYLAMTTKIYRF